MGQTSYEARQVLRDAAMRRALLEFLQEATREPKKSTPSWPEPMRDDEDVADELRRILGIRKGLIF